MSARHWLEEFTNGTYIENLAAFLIEKYAKEETYIVELTKAQWNACDSFEVDFKKKLSQALISRNVQSAWSQTAGDRYLLLIGIGPQGVRSMRNPDDLALMPTTPLSRIEVTVTMSPDLTAFQPEKKDC